jgi:hypothetical protein
LIVLDMAIEHDMQLLARSRSMCGEGRLSPSPPIDLHALNRRDTPAVQFRPGVCWGACRSVLPSRPSWRAGGLLARDLGHAPITGLSESLTATRRTCCRVERFPANMASKPVLVRIKPGGGYNLTTIGSPRWPEEVEANETKTKMRSKRPSPRQKMFGSRPTSESQRPS